MLRFIRNQRKNDQVVNNSKTRVFMCVKDSPGTLYKILSKIKTYDVENQNASASIGEDNHEHNYVVDLKHITIETCERFSKLPRTKIEAFSREIVTVAHRVRFHSLLEIRSNDKDKNREKFALAEITACLSGSNLLDNVLDLLEILGATKSQEERSGVINRMLVLPNPSFMSNPVSRHIQNSLRGELTSNFECPKMGTCPLANFLANDNNAYDYANDGIGNEDNTISIELKFLRDHGCYTKNTLLEFVFSLGDINRHAEKEIGISAIVLEGHYPLRNTDNTNTQTLLEIFMDDVKKKLEEPEGSEKKKTKSKERDFMYTFAKKGDKEKAKLIAFKKYHSCEYYPCYIVRNIQPELELGEGNGDD